MKARHSEHIDRLLHTLVVQQGVAPGAVAAVAHYRCGHWHRQIGHAGTYDPFETRSVSDETIYDLASLTKPILAVAFARAADQKLLAFGDPLSRLLPYCTGSPLEHTRLVSLLAHRSGLAPHRILFDGTQVATKFDRTRALEEVVHCVQSCTNSRDITAMKTSSGVLGPAPAAYSDLGYILLGEALERATGCRLDQWIGQQLAEGGISEIWSARQMRHQGVSVSRVAPTEVMAYRGGLVRAQVHDDNAWALNGLGCSGHAGLFGTAEGVLAFARLMIDVRANRSRFLTVSGAQMLLDKRPDSTWRVGFDGKSASASSVGTVMSEHAFGHLGFTGTSFWCDPKNELVVVLLTNRVCPNRDNTGIRQARPLLNDALATLALQAAQS